ncbi:MAG: DUF930 domain-containing protein [Hyphomicrobiales bacterium]|nr:DUF930 domain-containing protein [Hyphomicrobiales bacterium]
MRVWEVATGAAVVLLSQAVAPISVPAAADARLERSLRMLAPAERLEQLCDYTAMASIRKDAGNFRPERAVANAGAEVKVKNDTIVANAGAFRSRGKWYGMAYTCSATPDHMQVLSFQYTIGGEIPEAKWATYGLFD